MKKILFTAIIFLFTISVVQAQEEGIKEKIKIKLKDGEELDIYVDGKKFDFPLELIDESSIASISVLKDVDAIKKYNSTHNVSYDTSKSVLLISTKKQKTDKFSDIAVTGFAKDDDAKTKIKITGYGSNGKETKPLIIVDGKKVDNKVLKEIDTNDIESINVIKGEEAKKKYNAPNGVILITKKKLK
ncbi:Plug domain-containing protein [Polaribacter sp.]|nr:Plug domain-containing protein [Polaribacter sp.]